MSNSEGGLLRHFSLRSATALVIANIIGAGIFTSTGFQVAALGHPGYIFLLWVVGGLLAFCGALAYAELGAAIPEEGAEYAYLRESYGVPLAFMSAFVSLTAGFSAPIAAALEGFVWYLGGFFSVFEDNPALFAGIRLDDVTAVILCWVLVGIHLGGARGGTAFNDLITLTKVIGIVVIIGAAFLVGRGDAAHLVEVHPLYYDLTLTDKFAAFGTSLIFVMFTYQGWNASAYVAQEMNNPQRDLPRSLLIGTGIVVLLYMGLNAVYFYGAGVDGLVEREVVDGVETISGRVEVGLIAARELFGGAGVTLVTAVLLVSILASASAMTIAGPRVYYAFGTDFPYLRFLTRTHPKTGAPMAALLLQGVVITAIIFTGRIDEIIVYAGFTLALFSSLAVSCVLVLRYRKPDLERPFKTWGYPWTPLLYLVVATWTMVWAFRGRPVESLLSLATVAVGGILFYVLMAMSRAQRHR